MFGTLIKKADSSGEIPIFYLYLKIRGCILFFWRCYLFFRERAREGEREGDKINRLSPTCRQPHTWLTAQTGALTGTQTCELLVLRLVLNPLMTPARSRDSILSAWIVQVFHTILGSIMYSFSIANPYILLQNTNIIIKTRISTNFFEGARRFYMVPSKPEHKLSIYEYPVGKCFVVCINQLRVLT